MFRGLGIKGFKDLKGVRDEKIAGNEGMQNSWNLSYSADSWQPASILNLIMNPSRLQSWAGVPYL